jgi:arabinose-5-phosphate isomerase
MEGLLDRRAGDVATREPRVIAPEMLASEALAIMNAPTRRITCLFVTDGGVGCRPPLGLLHIHDCLRAGVA